MERNEINRLKNCDIPYINLSKENLILIFDSLEEEQAGRLIFAITQFLYNGTEPTFETKIERSIWNNVMLFVNRKADGYFVKAAVARENGKKGGRPKKSALQDIQETEFDIPQEENNPATSNIENKADLSHFNSKGSNLYHQEVEMAKNSPKIPLNDNLEIEVTNNNSNNDNNMGNYTGITIVDGKAVKEPYMEQKYIKVAASKQTPQVDIQELLNKDDELLKYYLRYVQYTVEKNTNPKLTTANSLQMAEVAMNEILKNKYNLTLSSIMEFLNNDIEYSMNNMDVA